MADLCDDKKCGEQLYDEYIQIIKKHTTHQNKMV